jgi:formylglycine-generating enzyme required for sulfatase activity
MVPVDGLYCPFVAHRCDEQVGADERGARLAPSQRRCRRYRDELICQGRPVKLHFCIDRLEYPNLPGARPVVLVDYRQAAAACAAEGKRVCEAEEWVFACEGKRTWPYPFGLERDPGACNIDRRRRSARDPTFDDPWAIAATVEPLDQRTVSGGLPRCVSPFGAFDMCGNVTEWVHFREGRRGRVPSDTALAGGHWDRVAASCRLLDLEHGASHRDYRTGFRCCADGSDGARARRLMPPEVRLPLRRRMVASSPLP